MIKNEIVEVIKKHDKNFGKKGIIVKVTNLMYVPVTIYDVVFEDKTKGEYFYLDLKRVQ